MFLYVRVGNNACRDQGEERSEGEDAALKETHKPAAIKLSVKTSFKTANAQDSECRPRFRTPVRHACPSSPNTIAKPGWMWVADGHSMRHKELQSMDLEQKRIKGPSSLQPAALKAPVKPAACEVIRAPRSPAHNPSWFKLQLEHHEVPTSRH